MVSSEDYISIVIPYFKRSDYLHNLIESIRNNANFPYEIVVHDDSGCDLQSWNDRDLIAELILNLSINVGLHKAINRGVSIASSSYILMLNQDMLLTKGCFKEIVDVLRKPYVGIVSPYYLTPYADNKDEFPEYLETNGTRFSLGYGIGAGCAVAFRKEYWQQVGGYNENTVTGCSDTPIIYKCWKNGFFRAALFDTGLRNVSLEERANNDTTIGTTGTDCAYPKIIGVGDLDKLMHERSEYCQQNQNNNQSIPEGDFNGIYWGEYSKTVIPDNKLTTINWEAGKKYGQDKWKNVIMNEQVKTL